jgi:hypothetical protein
LEGTLARCAAKRRDTLRLLTASTALLLLGMPLLLTAARACAGEVGAARRGAGGRAGGGRSEGGGGGFAAAHCTVRAVESKPVGRQASREARVWQTNTPRL